MEGFSTEGCEKTGRAYTLMGVGVYFLPARKVWGMLLGYKMLTVPLTSCDCDACCLHRPLHRPAQGWISATQAGWGGEGRGGAEICFEERTAGEQSKWKRRMEEVGEGWGVRGEVNIQITVTGTACLL